MTLESKLTEQQLFDQLISSLVHSAWVYLGKIKNPMNDKLEKNVDQASVQIEKVSPSYGRRRGPPATPAPPPRAPNGRKNTKRDPKQC